MKKMIVIYDFGVLKCYMGKKCSSVRKSWNKMGLYLIVWLGFFC